MRGMVWLRRIHEVGSSPMRILVNAASCRTGGAIQVGASFVASLGEVSDWRGTALLSRAVREAVPASRQVATFEYVAIDPPPGRALRGRSSRRTIGAVAASGNWDCVFTIYGPAYVSFRRPHLMGFADPWVSHALPISYLRHRWNRRVVARLKARYKLRELRTATEIVTETETARQGLLRKLKWSGDRIHVIPNAGDRSLSVFLKDHQLRPVFGGEGPVTVLCIAAAYPHKNTILVADVAQELKALAPSFRCRFLLTLDPQSTEWRRLAERTRRLAVSDQVQNLGPVKVQDLPGVYEQSDLVLQPSLLETFSATYVEAFETQRPLVASRLSFAEEVCGDAAMYFDPTCARECAQAILRLAHDPEVRGALVSRGTKRLLEIGDADAKFERQVRLIERFCARYRSSRQYGE